MAQSYLPQFQAMPTPKNTIHHHSIPHSKRLISKRFSCIEGMRNPKIIKESKQASNPESEIIEGEGGLSVPRLKFPIDGLKIGEYYIHLL